MVLPVGHSKRKRQYCADKQFSKAKKFQKPHLMRDFEELPLSTLPNFKAPDHMASIPEALSCEVFLNNAQEGWTTSY